MGSWLVMAMQDPSDVRSSPLEDDYSSFLRACPPPSNLSAMMDEARTFVARHQTASRHVVLVTSGGTSIPLEKNTVRYLDNFSSGGRGAASAECFLRHGYAVVFLHRATSLKPFHRHLMNGSFLDSLNLDESGTIIVGVSGEEKRELAAVLSLYHSVKESGSLLLVPYTSLFDYAHFLKELCLSLSPLGAGAMLYLAAAVSDFYLPVEGLAEHKIASSGKLQLSFCNTPKLLLPLRRYWAPSAFTITFKLESDEDLLVPHARAALEKYRHQVVVANLLQSRRTVVTVVTGEGEERVERGRERDIETTLVDRIVTLHTHFRAEH